MFRRDQVRCNYCPDTVQIIEDFQAGDMICSGCGLVIVDRVIDVGAEWRTFSNDTMLNKSRVGAEENLLYDGMDLSTMIGQTGTSSAIVYTESGERKYRNKKFLNSSQRSMVSGFKEISEMAEKLNTTRPVIECGQAIFKKIQTKHALRGRSNESIAAACLYLAYRKNSVPRTFKEICAVAKANKRDIGKCYKIISKVIGEVIEQSSVVEYIPRFCAHLGLPNHTEIGAVQIVRRFEEVGLLAGRSPTTIAALAILIAIERKNGIILSEEANNATIIANNQQSKIKIMKEISEVTGAAESTIRDAYQVVQSQASTLFANILVPQSDATSSEHSMTQPNN